MSYSSYLHIFFKIGQCQYLHVKPLAADSDNVPIILSIHGNLVRKSHTFLGHVISEEGIKMEDSKVNSVCNFYTSKNVK